MTKYTKPTVDSLFHIDMGWWEESGRDFRLQLRNQLCDNCRERFENYWQTESVDWIDPQTAEVKRTDALWQCLRNECVNRPDFISERLPLTAAVFRVFLANDNQPLSPRGLHEIIRWKTPETILRTIAGGQVFFGVRPVPKD